ncbi:PP137 [Orf virus]|uniref:PP137 n=1 Tax=Orf virus TaxID=10258 RepID=F1AWU3_ORFV|nr:PP137 [Orf virus]
MARVASGRSTTGCTIYTSPEKSGVGQHGAAQVQQRVVRQEAQDGGHDLRRQGARAHEAGDLLGQRDAQPHHADLAEERRPVDGELGRALQEGVRHEERLRVVRRAQHVQQRRVRVAAHRAHARDLLLARADHGRVVRQRALRQHARALAAQRQLLHAQQRGLRASEHVAPLLGCDQRAREQLRRRPAREHGRRRAHVVAAQHLRDRA